MRYTLQVQQQKQQLFQNLLSIHAKHPLLPTPVNSFCFTFYRFQKCQSDLNPRRRQESARSVLTPSLSLLRRVQPHPIPPLNWRILQLKLLRFSRLGLISRFSLHRLWLRLLSFIRRSLLPLPSSGTLSPRFRMVMLLSFCLFVV